MTEYLGGVAIPAISAPSGTFPIVSDYGYGRTHSPQVEIHQFGSGNGKIEQRFLLGTGAKRFTVRRAALYESDRVALRDFWENHYGPYGSFTYNAPNESGIGTTAFTCRFANEPLSWELLSDAICSVGVNLIEIPTTSPTYPLNSTVTRFPSSALETALLDQVQEIIPLIKIQAKQVGYSAIYISDRRCTVGTQLYQARLLDWDGISQSIGPEADEAQFTLGNADRVMRDLVNDVDLRKASIEFSLYHVGTGIKLDLWKGEISDWSFGAGAEFKIVADDGLDLTLPYPVRRVCRTCWKLYDDGNGCPYTAQSTGLDTVNFPDVNANSCDKNYDTPNGCLAHGMKYYFGGIIAEPQAVRIKDNSQGTWGYGRPTITANSIVNDSIYDQLLAEVYTDNEQYKDDQGNTLSGRPVNCKIAAGRDESDFYEALGIVGEGPVTFNVGHKLDNQYHHGYPGTDGLREIAGNDPAGAEDFMSLDEKGDSTGGDFRKTYTGGRTYKDNFAAGTAAVVIRRADEKGIQLSKSIDHAMQAIVLYGIKGWVWTAAGVRTWEVLSNPIWIAINARLRAIGLRFANASTAEQYFDVTAAIAAATICNNPAEKMFDPGYYETQFPFRGIIEAEKPLRDWITEILMNCLGFYVPSFGKLDFGIRENASVVEAFTDGNILFGSLQLAPLKPAFNHLTANFTNAGFNFAGDSLPLYDEDDAKLIGGATSPVYLKSQINLCGVNNRSHAGRIITTRLREELGGVTAAEKKAARLGSWGTTILALKTKPGMVVSMTHADMPSGSGKFRVTGWKLGSDYSIQLQGRTVTDSMYDMTVGPKPADVQADPVPAEFPPAAVDTDNPSGLSDASIQTNETDLRVPADCMAFRFNRDTLNYRSIDRVEVVLRPAIPDVPAHGAYSSQRAEHPDDVLAYGSDLPLTPGQRILNLAIADPPALNRKLFLYFVSGGDQGLDGEMVSLHEASQITLAAALRKKGTYDWVIIEPPWNLNAWEAGFNFPDDFINSSREELVWQTKPVPIYSDLGSTKCEIYSHNKFGMTQLTP